MSALLIVTALGWFLAFRKLKRITHGGHISSHGKYNGRGGSVLGHTDEKAQFQRVMSLIKANDTRALTPALQQWLKTLTGDNAQLSQFASINSLMSELYAARFAKNNADKNAQSKQIKPVFEKLSTEIKRLRSEWQKKHTGDSNRLSDLYPAS